MKYGLQGCRFCEDVFPTSYFLVIEWAKANESHKEKTQKEFNDTVKSNIEDLGMDVEEAIEDAISVFHDMGLFSF